MGAHLLSRQTHGTGRPFATFLWSGPLKQTPHHRVSHHLSLSRSHYQRFQRALMVKQQQLCPIPPTCLQPQFSISGRMVPSLLLARLSPLLRPNPLQLVAIVAALTVTYQVHSSRQPQPHGSSVCHPISFFSFLFFHPPLPIPTALSLVL